MAIIIDTPTIHKSLASLVLQVTPSAYIYDNPNQQGTHLPAWFIVHREPVNIKEDLHGRYWLNYGIDLYYMLDFNLPHLFDDYAAIADQLGEISEYLPIYGYEGVVTHTYERSWGMYMDALKFSMNLKFRVTKDATPPAYMEVIEDLSVFLKGLKQEFYTLSFTNTDHPDFTVELPDDIVSEANTIVKLPSVYAKEVIDDETWVPFAWDIGEFGQSVYMNENKVANLLWKVGEFVTLSFENVTYPQFDVELPEPMLVESGTSVTLPSVYGEFEEDGTTYIPEDWDIGGFGESVTLELDTTAILLWRTVEPVGPVYPQGQFTYGEMQTNPDKQVELNAIPFDSGEDELMAVTGNARDFIDLEFIPDAGFEFVMGLNGLMEIWTKPTEPIDIDVNFGDAVTIPAGYTVESVQCQRLYVKATTVTHITYGQFVEFSFDGENEFCDLSNTSLIGMGVDPCLTIFSLQNTSGGGYWVSWRSASTSGIVVSGISDKSLNSNGVFCSAKVQCPITANADLVANGLQTFPALFRYYDSTGTIVPYFFKIQQSVWRFSGGVFSWFGDTTDTSNLAYWYNGIAVRIHCVPA